MSTGRKTLLGIITFMLFYTIAGFYILPAVLKPVLEKNLGERLKRPVTIGDIDMNPYTLSASIKWLEVKDLQGDATFVSLDELYVNLQAVSAMKRALFLKEIRLQNPYVKIVRQGPQQYNFSDLMQTPVPTESTNKEPARFFLGNIKVTGGRIDIVDSPMNTSHQISEILVSLPFLSNIGKDAAVFTQPRIEAVINGTRTVFEGQTKPFDDSLETIFRISFAGIDIPYYMEYMPKEVEIKIPSGTLDLQAEISYTQFRDRPPSLDGSGRLKISNLTITDTMDLEILSIPLIGVDIAQSEFLRNTVHLSDIRLASPVATVRRDKNGNINIASIVKDKPEQEEITEQRQDKILLNLIIDQIGLKDGMFTFSDEAVTEPVDIRADNILFTLKGFSTTGDKPATAETALRINKKGSVSASAAFGIAPVFCDATISVDAIEPAWVEPYFSDQIRIMITRGSAAAKGLFTLKTGPDEQYQATFKGNAALSDFASVDKERTDDFISWKSLSFNGMNMGFNPAHIAIEEIALTDLFAHVIVNPEGELNLNTVIRKGDESGSAAEEKGSRGNETIQIEKVSIRNGKVSFIDRHIEPYFSTQLENIEGSITGLTSMETKAADVDLSASLDNSALLLITGKINPLSEDLFVDLHTTFKDIDLSPASPYSGKYVGNTIQKGKLSLDLTYLIDNKNLDSKNKVLLDQFTFGEKVDSADALDLPVLFAVSLLKDPAGRISLDLPVTGRTDDPEFSIGKIILQVLVNIVKKAATSPFSLLSSMYPGADNLSNVEFDPGRSTFASSEQEKIELLVQILRDKPSITLEITGYANTEHDQSGLIQYFFEKKLKSRKLMDLIKKGQHAISVDEVVIYPDEYEHYLSQAYKAETFEKPTTALGLAASLPAPEMERLIKEHIQVNVSDMRLLASQRAQQVKNFLIQTQSINPDRIFLIEASSPLDPEKKEGISDSRAELCLK